MEAPTRSSAGSTAISSGHAIRGVTVPLDSGAKTAILTNVFGFRETTAKDR
jgi:hypothetical protein